MMQFLIAAPRSGSGKTTVTCAVLTALQRRGTDPCAAHFDFMIAACPAAGRHNEVLL